MIRASVVTAWQCLTRKGRRELRGRSMRASDAVMRCRCKVILALVRGKTPTTIANGGLCAKSQIYRVAGRFLEQSWAGLADRRKDHGQAKVDRTYDDFARLAEADAVITCVPTPLTDAREPDLTYMGSLLGTEKIVR